MVGKQVGSWVLDRELGHSLLGEMYLAHAAVSSSSGPVLALVTLHRAGELDCFSREAEILRQLDHPGILRFLGSGSGEGCSYLAMEYVAGPDLATVLRQRGRLPWKDVLDLGLQIAPALKHAH